MARVKKMKFGTLGFHGRLLNGKPVKEAIALAQNYLGIKISLEVFHGHDGFDGLIIERNRSYGRPTSSMPVVSVDFDVVNSKSAQSVILEAIIELHDLVATCSLK